MDDLKRQVLRNLTVELTDNINPGALVPYLYQKRLLTRDEFERVSLPTMTRLDKNLHILQVSIHTRTVAHMPALYHSNTYVCTC